MLRGFLGATFANLFLPFLSVTLVLYEDDPWIATSRAEPYRLVANVRRVVALEKTTRTRLFLLGKRNGFNWTERSQSNPTDVR